MDLPEVPELVMTEDSDLSDINESSDEEFDMGAGAADSTSSLEESDENVGRSTQPPRRPSPSGAWGPASRQPHVRPFQGWQGPTAAAAVQDVDNPADYFHLIFTEEVRENC